MFGYDKVLDDQADQARTYNDVMVDAMDRFVVGHSTSRRGGGGGAAAAAAGGAAAGR